MFEAISYTKSSHAQDLFIYERFHNKWEKVDGLFVDVGAKDGIETSNTYFFEAYLGWNGICFEPNPLSFFKCQKSRKGPVYPIGIGKGGRREFFCCPNTPGWSGIIENYHPEHKSYEVYLEYKSSENVIQIETVPLQNILDVHKYRHIHFLDVDTEGGELEILDTIDYQKTHIDVINVENLFSKERLRLFLKKRGFVLFHEFPNDDLFVHETFL
ncbi:MAG: FkbM family methyltransferase [Parachlamydiales bacterium]|nr:FkbM family methyltransferase [Parachlamydiales bacterium]